ncbi:MAG: hypothetical protein FWE37_09240 [Spirochaetaceae bacterium]|nr:hypothetical protein [Spirochaetaceae bacterium]
MFQLFFLFIISGALCGLILASSIIQLEVKLRFKDKEINSVNAGNFIGVIIAIVATLISLVHMFWVGPGQIPFIGNLLPCLAVLLMAKIMLYDAFRAKYPLKEGQTVSKAEQAFIDIAIKNKVVIGLIGLALIVLHFFFQGVPLL